MSEHGPPWEFIIVAGIVFPLIWVCACAMIMKMGGLRRTVDTSVLGMFVDAYGNGSGWIDGVSLRNCLMVDRYQHGYLLRTWAIFGGGKRVVRDEDIAGVTIRTGFLRGAATIELVGGGRIVLYGRPAKRVAEERGGAD